MLPALLIAFCTGTLTRLADMAADEGLRLKEPLAYGTGAAYGLLAGFLMIRYPVLNELGIALILAVILAMKIDHPVHAAGIASAAALVFVFGTWPAEPGLLAVLVLGGLADEAGNSLYDRGSLRGPAGKFFRCRLTMEAVTFGVSVYTGDWLVFLAMLSYDAGFTYLFPDRVRRRLIRAAGQ